MSQIWKTPLSLGDDVTTTIEHGGPQVLSVGLDPSGVPCVWYWAPEGFATLHTTGVVLVGTGVRADHLLTTDTWGRHVGTFVWENLVLHAFETIVYR